MAQMNVKVTGVSKAATMTWDGNMVSLVSNSATSFSAVAGMHVYAIVVFGSSGDPWTAQVTDGTTCQGPYQTWGRSYYR